jgi:peptidoglycan/LPS O-acetylase OafA/YrhL
LKIEYSTKRIYGLDILRALAILFVVYGHGIYITKEYIPLELASIPVVDGVSIFFVLSGFLIGGILMKTINKEGSSLKSLYIFWIRRWYRTLPNYFLILTLLVSWYLLMDSSKLSSASIPLYYSFLQNFYHPHPQFFGEAWSLAVEEWFYLLMPILAFGLTGVLRLECKRAIPLIALAFIVGITFVRFYKYTSIGVIDAKHWDLAYRKVVLTRLDSIMYGVLGAYAFLYLKQYWNRWQKPLLFIGLGGLLVHHVSLLSVDWSNQGAALQLYYTVFSFSLVSISTLLVIPWLNSLKTGKGFLYRALTYISLISYSMYLINATLVKGIALPVTFRLLPAIGDPFIKMLIGYGLFWGYTIVGSILLYKYFEMPFMRLRDVPWGTHIRTRLRTIPAYVGFRGQPTAVDELPQKEMGIIPHEETADGGR